MDLDAVHHGQVLIRGPAAHREAAAEFLVAVTPGSVCSVRKMLSRAPGVRRTWIGATVCVAGATAGAAATTSTDDDKPVVFGERQFRVFYPAAPTSSVVTSGK